MRTGGNVEEAAPKQGRRPTEISSWSREGFPPAAQGLPDLRGAENLCAAVLPPSSRGGCDPGLLARGSASSGILNRDWGALFKDRL